MKARSLCDVALSTHGVYKGQAIKAVAVWCLVSGKPADRNRVQMMFGALDKYHGLPNGMFSCDEHFAGRIASQGSKLARSSRLCSHSNNRWQFSVTQA